MPRRTRDGESRDGPGGRPRNDRDGRPRRRSYRGEDVRPYRRGDVRPNRGADARPYRGRSRRQRRGRLTPLSEGSRRGRRSDSYAVRPLRRHLATILPPAAATEPTTVGVPALRSASHPRAMPSGASCPCRTPRTPAPVRAPAVASGDPSHDTRAPYVQEPDLPAHLPDTRITIPSRRSLFDRPGDDRHGMTHHLAPPVSAGSTLPARPTLPNSDLLSEDCLLFAVLWPTIAV